MAENARFLRNPAVTETAVDGDMFLVEPGSQEVFYLDAATAALWRCLAEPQTGDEIAAVFRAAFPDTDADRIARDVDAALAEMRARGLVVIAP